ncbi:MAG: class I SAM-dependent methyltransferase [Planctomycetota bacterium]
MTTIDATLRPAEPHHAHLPNEAARPEPGTPQADFHSIRYQTINARRLEHLASLGLSITGRSVLEVGAGIGDLTGFFVDRGCRVTATEGRPDNLELLRRRWQDHERIEVVPLQLDPAPTPRPAVIARQYDIVFCYGLLYHLSDPAAGLQWLADACDGMLLLETQASFGNEAQQRPMREDPALAASAMTGRACRPTRPWLHEALGGLFEHVYYPVTQPLHNEFPLAWTPGAIPRSPRLVVIASRTPIENRLLTLEPPAAYRPQP